MSAPGSSAAGASDDEKKRRLYCLHLYKYNEEPGGGGGKCTELVTSVDVSSFPYFHRSTIREFVKFHARTIAERTQVGRRQSVLLEEGMGTAHAWVHPQKIAGIILCGPEYPMRVAYQLISEVIRLFMEKMAGKWENAIADMSLNTQFPDCDDLLKKFQNPQEADKISKIEKDLEEVRQMVVISMDDILKRGENLDSLMQKSNDLSASSTQFYRTAKKNNQCCTMY